MKINELCILYQMLGKDAQTKPGMKLEAEEGRSGEGRAREAWEQVWLPSSGLSPHLLDYAGPQGSRGLSASIACSSLFGPCSVPHFSLTPTSSSYSGCASTFHPCLDYTNSPTLVEPMVVPRSSSGWSVSEEACLAR